MGDMADYAHDCSMDDMEEFWKWDEGGRCPQEGYDKGILNEYGGLEYYPTMPGGSRRSEMSIKPSGPGRCPLCGQVTVLKSGSFGKFYGCSKFPECKGSRNA